MNNKSYLFGLLMVLLYNFLDAGKEVYSGFLVQENHPLSITFIVFSIAMVFFQLYGVSFSRQNYLSTMRSFTQVLILNITTAGSWISFFYCMQYLEPAVASAIITGVAPLLIIYIAPVFFKNESHQYKTIFIFCITFCSLWLAAISLREGSLTYNYSSSEILIGVLMAVICSVFSIFSNIFSRRLSDRGCLPSSIMAHRFYIIVLITMSYSLDSSGYKGVIEILSPGIAILAIFGVVIPLWCLQHGIKSLSPARVMVFISVNPIFTFVFQFFDPRLSPTLSSLVAILLICFFSLASELWGIKPKGRGEADGYHGIPEDRRN
ncbi:DMT family transporter [Pantoea sp. BIGb0393]|uniref:DMT family transporter n=1 Tax=Pantoea nemavictus TaxID=2726955 RepID=A0ABU8PTJ9_9GAMM|nr:DMT family transporter [Pantoea nemavictus]MBA0036889.1 DMT family transporter [Pantoea nemavictus]